MNQTNFSFVPVVNSAEIACFVEVVCFVGAVNFAVVVYFEVLSVVDFLAFLIVQDCFLRLDLFLILGGKTVVLLFVSNL